MAGIEVDRMLLASAFITVGSFALACVMLVSAVRARIGLRRFVRVPGVVVDVRAREGPNVWQPGSPPAYAPVLAFRTVEGREVITESPRWSNLHANKVGHHVHVHYDPADPAEAYLDSPSGRPTLVYLLGFLIAAFICAIAGAVLLARLT